MQQKINKWDSSRGKSFRTPEPPVNQVGTQPMAREQVFSNLKSDKEFISKLETFTTQKQTHTKKPTNNLILTTGKTPEYRLFPK